MSHVYRLFLFAWSLVAMGLPVAVAQAATPGPQQSLKDFETRPRMVVLVVFDQMRADYLTRFSSRFLPEAGAQGQVGGFRWLMSKGAYFPFAEYGILQSMTGPGHATLLSGSYPYQMGISSNHWVNAETGQKTYCVADKDAPLVGGGADKPGMSPRNFLGTTVGDELKNAGHPSRVVAVSLKDRAAILMGGHRADLALWFDPSVYGWVTSRYYQKQGELPGWVQEQNRAIQARKGEKYTWGEGGKPTGLSSGQNAPDWKKTVEIGSYVAAGTPFGVDITVDAALKAMEAFKLGHGTATDVLAVSFSSHDYLGHATGPNSRDMEEMTVAEDRRLSRLLNGIRKSLPHGLKDVVVVLTADHGAPNEPDALQASGMAAGRISSARIASEVEEALTRRFDKPASGKWLTASADFQFWLDPSSVAGVREKADRATIEAVAASVIQARKGVAQVLTGSEQRRHQLPVGQVGEQAARTYFPGRSGDLILVPRPYFFEEGEGINHMTGYAYDRMVPLILAGPGLKPGVYAESARIVDLAPTLAYLLGVVAPAQSEGRVLGEAITTVGRAK